MTALVVLLGLVLSSLGVIAWATINAGWGHHAWQVAAFFGSWVGLCILWMVVDPYQGWWLASGRRDRTWAWVRRHQLGLFLGADATVVVWLGVARPW